MLTFEKKIVNIKLSSPLFHPLPLTVSAPTKVKNLVIQFLAICTFEFRCGPRLNIFYTRVYNIKYFLHFSSFSSTTVSDFLSSSFS